MRKKTSNSSQRLQEMMDKMNLKQSDIVSRTGITKSALSNYLHGTREPRQDQISKIADPYNINPSWLMGYDVPMFLKHSNKIIEINIPTEHLLGGSGLTEYYLNDETLSVAQSIFENKELGMLFDAAKDASPEDLMTVHQMLLALKKKENK